MGDGLLEVVGLFSRGAGERGPAERTPACTVPRPRDPHAAPHADADRRRAVDPAARADPRVDAQPGADGGRVRRR